MTINITLFQFKSKQERFVYNSLSNTQQIEIIYHSLQASTFIAS